ncbi:MAG: mechanosensitive ion channel family protein, partial [Bacteroidales bacterium]|nr:mechanosensitive ion channel family protein [Bacteroidales bacterium]
MKKKYILATLIIAMFAMPVFAVFNEKTLSRTLSVLRFELEQALSRDNGRPAEAFHQRNEAQHLNLVSMLKKCNELSLILYSQDQDFTFDMTYALEEVTSEYEAFKRQRVPYDDIMSRLNLEIDRYERLVEALRRLPPVLDEIDIVPDSLRVSKDSLMRSVNEDSHEHEHMEEGHHSHVAHDEHRHQELAAMDAGHDYTEEDARNLTNAIAMITGVEEHIHEDHDDDDEDIDAFILDEHGQEDRDSCIACAIKILVNFKEMKEHAQMDTEHYDDMEARLKEAYDYAQDRYRLLQRRIFVEGQDNYYKVVSTFPTYVKKALEDAKKKYVQIITPEEEEHHHAKSSWRGPVVVGFIFFVFIYLLFATILSQIIVYVLSRTVKAFKTEEFRQKKSSYTLLLGVAIFTLSVMLARSFMSQNFFVAASKLLLVYSWLLLATLLSLIIRSTGEQLWSGVKLYAPVLILGLVVIGFRIIFIPNRVLNLIYPPLLIAFAIWQVATIKKSKDKVLSTDLAYAWLTFVLMAVTAVVSLCGYVLMGVQIFIWWLFQLTAIATVTALFDLLKMYEKAYLKKALEEYRKTHLARTHTKSAKGTYIQVTWFFDMIEMAVVPVIAGLSILVCIWFASGVFDLKEICKTVFFHPFFNLSDTSGNAVLHLSLFKLVLVGSLYFVFRYLNYLLKALYRHYKLEKTIRESGQDFIHANQVNLTLANNVIGIVIWGIYIIMAILLMKIPMGAISIVAAGLATGIGLALKDVLNNFIYGIQLMSGRLRVGDYIECDGVRGKVDSISYQSTQIETVEGAVMAFTNASLFSSNFKNLTRNNSYELVKITVGVGYGANVSKIRDMLSEALQTLQKTDKYGRYVLDPKKPITVAFSDFGDSSVDLVVKQYVLVEEGPAYIAKAKAIIYNTLAENHVEIPFPQRDVYIRQ